MYCVHTPFSQEPTNSNTFTHSFIHSFIHSFFPSLESELTSQPQSTTIEKACKYWAKFRKRKRDGWKWIRAQKRVDEQAEHEKKRQILQRRVLGRAYAHTAAAEMMERRIKNDERNHENDVRSNNEENDKHCISSSNTQTRTHRHRHTHQYTPNLCWTTLKKLSLLNLACVCFGWTHGWFKVKPSLMKFYTSVSYFIKNLLKSIRIYLFCTRSVCVCARWIFFSPFHLLSSVQLDWFGLDWVGFVMAWCVCEFCSFRWLRFWFCHSNEQRSR